jgi:hypothetical protein
MSNTAGKSYGMTAFTPMEPMRTLGFDAVLLAIRAGLVPRDQILLKQLSFIHFARWVVIKRDQWPRLDASQPEETLRYDYLLFESNFNGSWDQYIEAFSRVIPGGMDNIWRWSVGFPGSVPISPFLDYIRSCQVDTDYYFNAYPGASTNDIRGALFVRDELEKLGQVAATASPAEFREAYDEFLRRVQCHLPTTGVRADPNDPVNTPPWGVPRLETDTPAPHAAFTA